MSENIPNPDEETDTINAHNISLNITHQYTKDLSFEIPSAPELFLEPQAKAPNINIDINVRGKQLAPKQFEVVLKIRVNAVSDSKSIFILELDYAGIAQIGSVPHEHIQPFVMIEVPRFLFPFARSIICAMVVDSGFPSILLNPVDFAEMYQQTKQQETN